MVWKIDVGINQKLAATEASFLGSRIGQALAT